MRLAIDDIVIQHGRRAVRLRPSLRAAYRLECRHGLKNVVDGIAQCSLDVIGDIIAETADDPAARLLLVAKVGANGTRELHHLAEPLIGLVAACYGVSDDPDDEHYAETRERAGKPFSLRRTLEELFGIATGWLGWSANDALAATPTQIIAAYKAHVAKLKVIYGSAENSARKADDPARHHLLDLPSDDEIRAGIARLKELASQRIGGRTS